MKLPDPDAAFANRHDDIGPDAAALCLAARREGVETDIVVGARRGVPEAWLRLHVDGRRFLYRQGVLLHGHDDPDRPFGPHVNGADAARTTDKERTKAILAAAGIPLPEGRLFAEDAQADAVAYAAALGGPVCIKPNRGWAGQYVSIGRAAPPEWGAAFRKARRIAGGVLVERALPGEVLRLFYVAPDCVAVKLHRAPGVAGDGRSTVAALIERRNERRALPGLAAHGPIRRDAELHRALAAQALTLESVPETGAWVRLGIVSNLTRGADSLDGRIGTDPSYVAVAVQACRAFPQLRIGAVDMMVTERDRPAADGNHWVLEINSSPGIADFLYPWSGAPQDVGARIIAFLQGAARPDK